MWTNNNDFAVEKYAFAFSALIIITLLITLHVSSLLTWNMTFTYHKFDELCTFKI